MSGQTFVFFPSFFFFLRGLKGLGCIYKNHCYFLMCSLIALKFGTNKEHIKGTVFGMNLISIQCVRSDDLCREWLSFRHAYRVTR